MISVVIPHYNNLQILRNCLKAISQSLKRKTEIIIVDNGSTDGSREYLEQLKAKGLMLKAIFNDRNYGFAKAVNQGIKVARNDWIVVMNNDVKVGKNWFKTIAQELKKLPAYTKSTERQGRVGCLFGKVLNGDGTKIESTGLIFWLKGKAFNRGNGEPANTGKYNSKEFVFGSSASIVVYYKPALEMIGFFDEDFFAYEEDIDLALRLHSAGWKTMFIPKAISYHLGGATTKKMGNFRYRMDAKNWWFIIIKNYPLSILVKHGPKILIERLKNLSGLIKNTSWYRIPIAIFKTYGELVIKFPKIIRKRSPISPQKLYEISENCC